MLETCKFGNTDKEADELFNLVVNGKKTATCSFYNNYSPLAGESESLIPVRGQKYYITNSNETKRILVEIIKVEIKKFCEVEEDFARKEGEADLSLEYWRKTHEDFFTKELQKQGKEFNENILLVCEEFKIVENIYLKTPLLDELLYRNYLVSDLKLWNIMQGGMLIMMAMIMKLDV